MGQAESIESTSSEWRCLLGGNPEFGYSASALVNGQHVVSEVKDTATAALTDLREGVERILREAGDQRTVTLKQGAGGRPIMQAI